MNIRFKTFPALRNFLDCKTICYGSINRIILFGGGRIFPDILKLLKKYNYEVIVVTSPTQNSSMADLDLSIATKIFVLSSSPSQNEELLSLINDETLAFSFSAVWIFKDSFIQQFGGRFVNVHTSFLPMNKGGGGLSYGLLRGDMTSGITIHEMTGEIDAGDILMQEKFSYTKYQNTPLMREHQTMKRAIKIIDKFFSKLYHSKTFKQRPQRLTHKQSYWPRINSEIHSYIDWSWTLLDLYRFICAFDNPYSGARTFLAGKLVKLKAASISQRFGRHHPFQQGIIFAKDSTNLFVAVKQGTLIIQRILDENDVCIFDQIKLGDRLYTPSIYIEDSMSTRVSYRPTGFNNISSKYT